MKPSAVRLVFRNPYILPGEYPALYSGYVVVFETELARYELRMDEGIRGIDVPCTVVVDDDGNIDVQVTR